MSKAKRTKSNDGQNIITLLDSTEAIRRLNERLLELYEMEPSDEIVDALLKAWDELKAAGRSGNSRRQQLAVAKIDTLMKEATEGSQRRKEIYKLEDQVDKMRDRALRRAMVEGTHVRVTDVQLFIGNMVAALKTSITKTLTEAGRADLAPNIFGRVAVECEGLFGILPGIAEVQSPRERERALKQQSKVKKNQS